MAETEGSTGRYARISDVPTDKLAHNFVGTLILCKGNVNEWDVQALHLIGLLRKGFDEDLSQARAKIAELVSLVCDAQPIWAENSRLYNKWIERRNEALADGKAK